MTHDSCSCLATFIRFGVSIQNIRHCVLARLQYKNRLVQTAEAGSSCTLPSAFQKLQILCSSSPISYFYFVDTGWKYILKRIHVKIFHKKCLPCFNELARFSQFIKYTHFLVPFFCCRKPPFGPHFTQNQVPILKNWGPLPMWERWHWYWVYSRILFLHSCILIL